MFILITIAILAVTALALLTVRLLLPGFRYFWPIAGGGGFLAWISVFVWQAGIPVVLPLPAWQPPSVFVQSPTFVADGIAWAFSLSVVTLCLAIIITSVVRNNFPSPVNWANILTLALLGVLASTANNPLTLVLIWAAIDLAELVSQLRIVETPRLSERVVIAFASRATGTLILLWADMVSASNSSSFDFNSAPSQAGVFLIIAAGFRLGVLPLHLPYPSESALRRGFGTGLRMISAASSLILLTRISGNIISPTTPYLLVFVLIAALYGSWMWLRAPDELNGRPFWLIGMGSLAVAAALHANPTGAAAWGCALLLSGSVLFLSSEPIKWLTFATHGGVLALSSLPLSLTSLGWSATGSTFWLSLPFLLLAQAMLIAGFIRHSQRIMTRVGYENQPIWAKNVYPIGILLIITTSFLLGLFGWEGALKLGAWYLGPIASALSLGLLWLTPRLRILNPVRAHWVRPTALSLVDIGYQTLWVIYRQLGRLSDIFTRVLEGESGIMWTLLFLALFISFFTQRTP